MNRDPGSHDPGDPGPLFRRPDPDCPGCPPDPPEGVEPTEPNNPEGKDLRHEAHLWMAENPNVMKVFERFAIEAGRTGSKFGISLLTERVRWDALVRTQSPDGYKINNNHRAYIARELIRRFPYLEELLRCRATRW